MLFAEAREKVLADFSPLPGRDLHMPDEVFEVADRMRPRETQIGRDVPHKVMDVERQCDMALFCPLGRDGSRAKLAIAQSGSP
jgi:hypothetical protein